MFLVIISNENNNLYEVVWDLHVFQIAGTAIRCQLVKLARSMRRKGIACIFRDYLCLISVFLGLSEFRNYQIELKCCIWQTLSSATYNIVTSVWWLQADLPTQKAVSDEGRIFIYFLKFYITGLIIDDTIFIMKAPEIKLRHLFLW